MANGCRSIKRDVLTGLKLWWLSRLQVSISYSFFKFEQMATFRWLGDGVWVIGDLLDLVAMAGGRRWSGARAREKCCAFGKFVLLLPGENRITLACLLEVELEKGMMMSWLCIVVYPAFNSYRF